MLEAAIPSLWSAVHGWFTPTVLFVLLNLVIGTIAVTSKSASSGGAGDAAAAGDHRKLARVPSLALDRIRSFNLARSAAPAAPPPPTVTLDPPPLPPPEKVEFRHEHEEAHIERCRSEASAGAGAPRLPARLRKSASDKSAFARFEAEDAEREAEVEARRPATAREVGGGVRIADEDAGAAEEEGEGGEVDARADDFINRFRHQLKLQRLDSILRHARSE